MGADFKCEDRRDLKIVNGVLYGADVEVARWVAQRIPGAHVMPDVRSLGVVRERRIVAGVVFDDFNGVHVSAMIAARPRTAWANAKTLREIFTYPFITLGVKAVTVTVPSSNPQSLRLATGLGFEPEALIKFAAHDGSTLVVLKMFSGNCRWIARHGKKEFITTPGAGSAGNSESRISIQPD